MNLFCLTADHAHVTLAVREQIAPSSAQTVKLLTYFSTPLVILTTCNRTEFYISSTQTPAVLLEELVAKFPALESQLGHCRWLAGSEVATQLYRVAAGLESQILGEGQVLAQVKRAYQNSQLLDRLDSDLHRLFQTALRVGKAVRTETGISRGNVSLAGVAVETAWKIPPAAATQRVPFGAGIFSNIAIVGTGETGGLIGKFLTKKKASFRNFGKFGAPLTDFYESLEQFDLVFIATRPRLRILRKTDLLKRERPLTVFDLGLPRHVAPSVRTLSTVRLFDLSDLTDSLSVNLAKRKQAALEAEQIVAQAVVRHSHTSRHSRAGGNPVGTGRDLSLRRDRRSAIPTPRNDKLSL